MHQLKENCLKKKKKKFARYLMKDISCYQIRGSSSMIKTTKDASSPNLGVGGPLAKTLVCVCKDAC